MNPLNLYEFDITLDQDLTHEYVFTAKLNEMPMFCPRCGSVQPKVYHHGSKEQLFRDTPMHGKRVLIRLKRDRYKCLECHQTFMEPLYQIDERRMATKRLTKYIATRSFRHTFTSIALEVGFDEKTIRNVFRDHLATWEEWYKAATPRWLGLDEIHILGDECAVLTNIEAHTLVDVLRDRNQPTIAKWLQNRPDRDTIEVVTMDMYRAYRPIIEDMLPQAAIVIDKFHVVRMASGALDQVRKVTGQGMTNYQKRRLMRERKLLLARDRSDWTMDQHIKAETWLENVPALKEAHEVSEAFYSVYDAANRAEAESRYDDWVARLKEAPKEVHEAFKPLLTATTNWREQIMNYFDNHRLTNAYTEAVNGVIRVVNRMGRGYSFEVIRARMLYEKQAIKEVEWPEGRRQGRMGRILQDMMMDQLEKPTGMVLGTDLSTLVRTLEEGL